MRTLGPMCPDCMWRVRQYCQLYLLDKENLVLLCSWNHLSLTTINHYMELEKDHYKYKETKAFLRGLSTSR